MIYGINSFGDPREGCHSHKVTVGKSGDLTKRRKESRRPALGCEKKPGLYYGGLELSTLELRMEKLGSEGYLQRRVKSSWRPI